jgi:xylulokinase
MADMAASALGTGLLQPERLAITLGTSGQITQAVEAFSPALIGRFTYHPHALPGKLYVMASLFTGGLGLQWLAEVLASLTSETQDSSIERVLRSAQASPPGARGVLFLPHLTGSGSPHFDASRAASFLGLKRHHTGSDLCRAVLEGVGFSVQACLDELLAHCPAPAEVVVGGGGMRNSLWRRIVCDITGRRLAVLREHDAGPLGTALAVSAGTSLCADLTEQIQLAVRIEEITIPVPEHHATYREAYRQYLKAVDA